MTTTETEIALTVHTDTRRVTVTRYDEPPIDLFLTVRDPDGPRDQEHGSVRMTPQAAEAVAHALLGIDSHHDLDAYAARVFAKHRRDCHDGNIDGDCAACSTAVGAGSAFTLSDLADLRARWANETQPYHPGGKLPRAEHYRLDRDGTMHRNPEYTGWHVTTGGKAPSWVDPYVRVLEQAAEINDLKAERDNALNRARAAEARAEDAAREASTWRTSTESAHSDFLQADYERDEWKARADRAEAQRDEYREGMRQALRDRELTEREMDERLAAQRRDLEAVYAVTEEQVDNVEVTIHTTATAREMTREYRTDRRTVLPGETPDRLRESIAFHLQSVAELEAIARAMEQD